MVESIFDDQTYKRNHNIFNIFPVKHLNPAKFYLPTVKKRFLSNKEYENHERYINRNPKINLIVKNYKYAIN